MKNLIIPFVVFSIAYSTLPLTPSVAHASTVNRSSSINLTNGLVGWWTFDGSVTNWATGKTNDVSGKGNTGQLVSMSTTTSPVMGKIGQGLKFDGSSSYIATNKALSTFMSAATGTISMWMYPSGAQVATGGCGSGNVGGVVDADNPIGGGGGYVWLGVDASNLCAGGYDGSNHNFSTSYTSNKWVHAVWVHNNGSILLYTNGAFKGSVAVGNLSALTHTVDIGAGFSTAKFSGNIDDVRVYNRALSAQEVMQLYNIGR